MNKVKVQARGGSDKKAVEEYAFLERLYAHLEAEKPARTFTITDEEQEFMKNCFLLTSKPVIYASNIQEDDMGKDEDELPFVVKVKEYAKTEGAETLVICAKTEEELSQMDAEDKALFMEEFGLGESGLDKLIKKSYALLGLISYLTAGEKETRAWTIVKGTKAPQAAGKIHTDFEKGFIRAEVTSYKDFVECGSYTACKEKGVTRLEGKEYIVQDGDIVHFRFAV
jgi:GTP-binding protein YchF